MHSKTCVIRVRLHLNYNGNVVLEISLEINLRSLIKWKNFCLLLLVARGFERLAKYADRA